MTAPLFPYLLRLGDDRLVLGHRLSEWCGHGPILEEDIALANVALDLIGQATLLLKLAGEVEGQGRNEDALAYFRDAIDFRNALLVELPKGDFAFTIVRQFLFSVFSLLQMEALRSERERRARRHRGEGGEGSAVSRAPQRAVGASRSATAPTRVTTRAQRALDELWRYTGELFIADDVDRDVAAAGLGVDPSTLRRRVARAGRRACSRARR